MIHKINEGMNLKRIFSFCRSFKQSISSLWSFTSSWGMFSLKMFRRSSFCVIITERGTNPRWTRGRSLWVSTLREIRSTTNLGKGIKVRICQCFYKMKTTNESVMEIKLKRVQTIIWWVELWCNLYELIFWGGGACQYLNIKLNDGHGRNTCFNLIECM